MRYRDISNLELIDMSTGTRLGALGQTDLKINRKTGQIEAFIMPTYKWFGIKRESEAITIEWQMIKKIGNEIILIETNENLES